MSASSKTLNHWLIASTFAMLAPAALACDEPEFNRDIPDGSNASQEQMDAIYEEVNEYVKMAEEYIACSEESSNRSQAERIRNEMLNNMERIAAQFNRQLRAFRRANS